MHKNIYLIKFTFIIFFSAIFLNLNAQVSGFNYDFSANWTLNSNAGITQYFGDVSNANGPLTLLDRNTDFAYGFLLAKQINPVFGLRLQYINGAIKGRKENYLNGSPANIDFYAGFYEFNLNTTIDILNIFRNYRPDRKFSVYGVFGLGISQFQGQTIKYSNNTLIKSIGNGNGSGLWGWELKSVINPGLGIKYSICKSIDITGELNFKLLNNDELDGQVGSFIIDMYSYSSMGITYKFGKTNNKNNIVYNEPYIQDIVISNAPEIITQDSSVLNTDTNLLNPEFGNNIATDSNKAFVTIKEKINETITDSITPKEAINDELNTFITEKLTDNKTIPQNLPSTSTNEFKVQIKASARSLDKTNIQNQFDINDEIREDYDGVWYRYSVGSYQNFSDAQQKADKLATVNKIKDAFVVGFKDGIRLINAKELVIDNSKNKIKELNKNYNIQTTEINENNNIPINPTDEIYYRVQIIALSRQMINQEIFKTKYQLNSEMYEEFSNNLYIYTIGNDTSMEKIVKLKNEIILKGIKDAFVVVYRKNRKVTSYNRNN